MKLLHRRLAGKLPWHTLYRWVAYSERRRLLDRDLRAHADWIDGAVLEIGSGRIGRRGTFAPAATPAVLWWTLDRSGANQPHLIADAQALPFTDQAFDVLVCLEVLEYVDSPQRVLEEFRRVLRSGSMLVLSIPFLHRADTPADRWRFTQYGLCQLVESAGFTVQVLDCQGWALLVVANILKFIPYLIHPRLLQYAVALAAWAPVMLLRWLDGPLANWLPVLKLYTTGYLIWARAR